MGLPANVDYCDVTARFIRAVIDGPDDDRDPDGVPIAGLSVKFAADLSSPIVKNQSAVPPVTIVIDPITCMTDENGVLLGPDGTPGIRLVASDDEDLSPHGWSYRVTLTGPSFPKTEFSFIAPADGHVDLASVVPVPANPGSQISSWQAVVAINTAARDETLTARDVVLQAIADFDPGEGGGEFSGTSDDITEGDEHLFLTDAERSKLDGLGTAAAENVEVFASAAQGELAATALQPGGVARLDVAGWMRGVFIENGGTIPAGLPEYTVVIEKGV